MGETLWRSAYHHLVQPGSMVLLGGWRRSRSWVTMMEMLVLALFLALVPLVSSFDKEPGLLELGLLAKYPEYQAVVRPFKKRNGGLNFKRTEGFRTSAGGNMTLPFTHSWTTSARTVTTSTKRQTSISFAGQTVLVQVTSRGASRPCCLRRTASSTWSRSSGERDSSLVPLVKPSEIWRQKRILSLSPACYADQDSSIKGSARGEKKPGRVAIFSGYKSFGLVVQLTV